MCSQCKAPVLAGHRLCGPCREQSTTKKTSRYAARLAAGLCPQCGGKRKKGSTKKLCERCLRQIAEKSREARARRKTDGVCAKCGARPAIPDSTQCFECRDKVNEGHQRRRRENPGADAARSKKFRDDMRAKGLCYKCGKKAAEGRVSCHDCLEKARESNRIARAQKKLEEEKQFVPDPTYHVKKSPGRIADEPARILRG